MEQRNETHIPSISAAVNVELDIAPRGISMTSGRWNGQSFALPERLTIKSSMLTSFYGNSSTGSADCY